MLQALSIRDFIIVDSLDLEFDQGFTALTGETGAGKSILIDALSLSLGARNDGVVTRTGCDKAEISTTFWVKSNAPVQAWLSEHEIDQVDELILRRVIYADGRSRAFVNGTASTVGQLKEIGEFLIDIYSQNAHHSLLSPHTQRQILDAFANATELSEQVTSQYKVWYQLHQQSIEVEKNAVAYADELAELRDQTREIKQLGFSDEEWQNLQLEHSRLSNGAALLSGSEACVSLIRDGEPAALTMLAQAQQQLASLVEYDSELKEAADGVEAAIIQLEEASRFINRYLQRADLDPAQLADVEARIQTIHTMSRKYRVKPEALTEVLVAAQTRMHVLESYVGNGAISKQTAEALANYQTLAQQLSAKRLTAAKQLSQQITQQMQKLSLSGGQFVVRLNPIEKSAYGLEQVEFLVAGHAGVEPRPLNKVASGGELSRISLALHVTTASLGSVPCMIFDEVDVGIGGGVAEVVGQLLKQLGQNRQVLVITHLAQVASQAQQHLQVSKTQSNGTTLSHINILNKQQRIEEVARMLGGLNITDTTLSHAKEMLGFV
jgi:DNA repair protein RecN (Recombination protein N)